MIRQFNYKSLTLWDVEDTFFGALLGAYLGTIVASIEIASIIYLILFFIIFPSVLRSTYRFAGYAIVLANIAILAWMILFLYDLASQNEILWQQGVLIGLVFMGWLFAKNLRLVS